MILARRFLCGTTIAFIKIHVIPLVEALIMKTLEDKYIDDLIAENERLRDQVESLQRQIQNQSCQPAYARPKAESPSDFISNIPGVLYQWFERANGECGYSFISSKCQDYYGVSAEELVEDWRRLPVHPDDMLEWADSIKESVETKREWRFEGRFLLADGDIRWWRGIAKPTFWDEHEVIFNGVLVDITDQKRAEEQLKRNEERLELILKSAELGQWDWNVQSGDVYFDEQWARLLGYSLEEISPDVNEWSSRVHPDDMPEVMKRVEECHRPFSDTLYEVEYRMKTKYGDWIWVLARGRVTDWTSDGKPLRMIGTTQDLTERKQLEIELLESREKAVAADRAKSEFLASMSHELRTPLNSIIGFARVLLKHPWCAESHHCTEYLSRINHNGLHLLGVIDDILSLSNIESGRVELNRSQIELSALLNNLVSDYQDACEAKSLSVNVDLPGAPIFLLTDELKLRRVLSNLLSNAVKFTPAGSITLRLLMSDVMGTPKGIEVADTGIGISENRLRSVFFAFEQGESGSARKYEGAGLGLAICKSLCSVLGYSLTVESRIGEGSTFRVVF